MKTISRFLGWMLALSMTAALLCVPVGATAYTDSESILYKEAVDVISALEIIGGYTDGSFKPENYLSRGAAAKVICNMMLTPEIANQMKGTATMYADVPAGNTYSGYVGWCASHGIVSGYSDGTFKPFDRLSGFAFMKMLLCALGYDQTLERLTGSGWSVNVQNIALQIGLDNGLTSSLDGSQPVNREKACLFAFNALQADMVQYNGNTAESRKTWTWGNSEPTYGSNINSNTRNGENIRQFAELYFPNLVMKSVQTDDVKGRQWLLSGELIGTYDQNTTASLARFLPFEETTIRIITFDANGGILGQISATERNSQNSKMVINSRRYGTLPTASRDGYSFDGWYTSPDDGNRITSASIVNLDKNQTLYAHWTPLMPNITVDDFSYNFKNDTKSFGYTPPLNTIPYERYVSVFGETARAKQVMRFDFKRGWGGNCYGMVSTSGLFYQSGNSISISGYHRGASHPYELSLSDSNGNLTLREFIEAMQISQSSVEFCTARDSNMDNLNGLVRAVTAFQESGGTPVVICMFGRMNEKESGHAVIAYRMENASETQSRIYVYDPNFPRDANRYITLSRSGNQYTGWSYMMNDLYEWGRSQNGISYIPYDTVLSCWNRRGNLVPDDRCRLMSMNVDNAAIYDENGNTLAVVENGQVIPRQSGVHQLLYLGTQTGSQASSSGIISMWLPQRELYSVEIAGNQEGIYRVSLVDVEEGIDVETTAHDVGLSADDSTETYTVEIHEADCQYVGRRILPSGSTPTSSASGGGLYAGASGSSGTSDPFDDGPIVGYGITGEQGVVVKVTGGVVDITE